MKAATALLASGAVVALVLVAVLAARAAGRDGPGALRNPGEDCVSCHREGGKALRSLFTVSGTVFRSGSGEPRESGAGLVEVILEDAAGRRIELTSNAAGNFWSRAEVLFPVQVSLRSLPEGEPRQGPADRCDHGNCNQCHSAGRPGGQAPGRLVRP